MVMLSDFLHFRLVDRQGRQARLLDLGVDLSAGDYPPITCLAFAAGRQRRELPWKGVAALDWRSQQLRVADLDAGRPASTAGPAEVTLLARDVLDTLVVDLANRDIARANDLWLRELGGRLLLAAVDASLGGILRRLSGGLLARGPSHHLLDWKQVEFLHGDPHRASAGDGRQRGILRLSPSEIADLAEAIPYLHAAELLTLIPDPLAADTLEAMTPERQLQVFEELDPHQAMRLLALMAPDIAADLVGRLPTDLARRQIEQLPPERRERLIELLRYPEDTAGGIMTNDLVVATAGLTVGQARRALVDQLEQPDFVYYVYVVDDEARRRLQGVLTLRGLLLASPARRLEEVMRPHPIALGPLESASAAAQQVFDLQLAALPVVARDGRLLGAVTFDAAMAQMAPRVWGERRLRVFS
ncbi:MAG: magnesium transporter [Chloroflexi bacterium]|nr:magnesium transporter [Chloroflexota bacterium]